MSYNLLSIVNRLAAILKNGCRNADNFPNTKFFIYHISVECSPICNSFEFLNSKQDVL